MSALCSCPLHGKSLFGPFGTPADLHCPFCDLPLCRHCFEHCGHECRPPGASEFRGELVERREPVPA